jgi:tetratricopeptide (TPR) repeat protein
MIRSQTCSLPRSVGAPLASSVAVVAALLGSSTARAQQPTQDDAVVVAQALFKAARGLVEASNYAEACPKFEASLALYPSASTMINLAKCHEQEQKLATAWAEYNRALVLNLGTVGAERQKALEDLARQGIATIEPRLPRLRIVIPLEPAGIRVLRDGNDLPVMALGEPLPADPGQHEVSVSAPGYQAETRSVHIEEGKTVTVEISLQPVPAAPSARQQVAAAPPAPARGGGSRLPAGVAFGLGAIALSAGAVTGALSLSRAGEVKSHCYGNVCSKSYQDQANSAKTLGDVSTAAFVAGGIGAATGALLLLLRPAGEGKPAAVRSGSWRTAFGPGQVEVQGWF